MSEILRTRVIRPSTRKEYSKSYKIQTASVGLNDTLRVEITHESKPGRWIYRFAGLEINRRERVSFRVMEESGDVTITWGNLQQLSNAFDEVLPARTLVPIVITKQSKPEASGRTTSLPPVITQGCTVLVLGTMPGEKSLKLQQYYAHPRNKFWNVMASVIGEPVPTSYDERMRWLTQRGIALWDTAYQCQRKGSLDSNITKEEPNDIHGLLNKYQTIRAIAFNGGKAEAIYSRFFRQVPTITYYGLLSTSPANTTATTGQIGSQWAILKPHIKGGIRWAE